MLINKIFPNFRGQNEGDGGTSKVDLSFFESKTTQYCLKRWLVSTVVIFDLICSFEKSLLVKFRENIKLGQKRHPSILGKYWIWGKTLLHSIYGHLRDQHTSWRKNFEMVTSATCWFHRKWLLRWVRVRVRVRSFYLAKDRSYNQGIDIP